MFLPQVEIEKINVNVIYPLGEPTVKCHCESVC